MPFVMTAEEINRMNKAFWADEKVLMDQRLQRRELVVMAAQFLEEEAKRQVPVGYRRSFEKILQEAEDAAVIFAAAYSTDEVVAKSVLSEAARKAGSAPKTDTLGKLIKALVDRRPRLTLQELLATLDAQVGLGTIQDIDETSVWITTGKNRTKQVPISGLRTRLSRAKMALRRTQSR